MKKSDKTLKQFPVLKTDQEAEDFVETVDLSEYDLSSMEPVKFELSAKDERLTIRKTAYAHCVRAPSVTP